MKYEIEVCRRAGEKIPKKLIEKVVGKTLAEIKKKSANVSVAFVGGTEIKKWNNLYRKKNKVTDVLSFDYRSRKTPIEKTQKNAEIFGEIVVCYSVAARQAKEHGWGIKKEIVMLLIHGVLHLAGYDHEKSGREARKMDKLQNKIFKLCLALAV